MSTYSIHSPIHTRRAGARGAAQHAGTAIVIAVCVLAIVIGLAFLAAATTTSINVKHLGHATAVTAADDTIVVASNNAIPHPAVSGTVPTRAWRETLHGRALVVSR
jgi:hypothetical protein